jgi:hypothetical protein
MVGVAYTDTLTVKGYLGQNWGPDNPVLTGGSANTRDVWIANEILVCSRLFDRESGRPSNWWQSAPGTTREYAGNGDTWLDVDEWDAITAVTMSTTQNRSDAITLSLTPGTADYVAFEPITGPPFDRLYLLRGWLPDVFGVGNIRITGTPTQPIEISSAVAIWVAYRFKRRDAGWADPGRSSHGGQPGAPSFAGDVPMEVLSVLTYYRERFRSTGPRAAIVAGEPVAFGTGPGMRRSLWMDWQTTP